MKTSKILAVDLVKIDSFLYCWSTSVDSRSLHGMLVSGIAIVALGIARRQDS